jgi:hypothetical protein
LPGAINFQIYPADKSAKQIQQERRGSTSRGQSRSLSALITFKSKFVELLDAKTLRVRGDLTATYVSQTADFDPSKAYSGPIFGPPVTHSVKREVTFIFREMPHAGKHSEKRGYMEWSASSTVLSDTFPELWNAVVTTDWPAFVLGEQCTMPFSVGEDFSGPACKGKVVEPSPRTDTLCAMPSDVGEDFTGVICSGTPLAVVPKREDEKSAGGGHGSESSPQVFANEVEIELAVRMVKPNPSPPKAPPSTGDPTANAYKAVEEAAVGSFRHLQASGDFEFVRAKPLGDGFVGVPVTEDRGALLRPFLEDRMPIRANFSIASGYIGQTTETIPPQPAPYPMKCVMGIPLKSCVTLI